MSTASKYTDTVLAALSLGDSRSADLPQQSVLRPSLFHSTIPFHSIPFLPPFHTTFHCRRARATVHTTARAHPLTSWLTHPPTCPPIIHVAPRCVSLGLVPFHHFIPSFHSIIPFQAPGLAAYILFASPHTSCSPRLTNVVARSRGGGKVFAEDEDCADRVGRSGIRDGNLVCFVLDYMARLIGHISLADWRCGRLHLNRQ